MKITDSNRKQLAPLRIYAVITLAATAIAIVLRTLSLCLFFEADIGYYAQGAWFPTFTHILMALFVQIFLDSLLIGSLLAVMVFVAARVIRLREDDLAEREKRLSTLETQIDDLTAELAAEEEKTAAQTQQIEELLTTVNSAESSASQSQYDLSEQQKELEKATDENAALEEQVTALEKENDRLRADYDTLYAAVDAQGKKLRFMDSYVVFIEDDGTGNYHRYDCGKFSKKNFWAYSRKLAERQGYTPCAQCFGS